MKTLNFWMHKEADHKLEMVCIQVPAECCGVSTKIDPSNKDHKYQDCFLEVCSKHMGFYPRIWNNFVVDKIHGVDDSITYGRNCRQCSIFYPDAIDNQSDNTFKCWACRHGW